MDSIRIERLRCLSDTGYIEIKPITVLLGQNSSGKSTFLRVFPLLKQSVESRTTGPILWNGRLVDFGSYQDALQNNSDEGISFSFKFKVESNDLIYPSLQAYYGFTKILDDFTISLTLQVSEDKKKGITKTKRLILLVADDSEIQIEFGEDEYISKFQVNSLNLIELGNKYISRQFRNRAILPIITELEEKKDSQLEFINFLSSSNRLHFVLFPRIIEMLIEETKKIARPSSSHKTIIDMAFSFGIGSSQSMLNSLKKYYGRSCQKRTKDWTIETESFKILRDLIIANSVPSILEECDQLLGSLSKQFSYMGPVRATAERYYRTQDLAVDEVDYQGRNLAMFLRNLTEDERESFTNWTLENFDFEPVVKTSLGHISLTIRHRDSDKEINVTDTGFGFSQILPVITQLWLLSEFPKRNPEERSRQVTQSPVIFAIEQPELHLHPRLQGTITDAFVTSVKAAKEKNIDFRLVVETHSEALVNRLGHLVAEGKISHEDINIVLFEPSDELGKIKVRTSQFDSDGYLNDWPLGFFDMD
ncbi:MAG TPA: hypothetical protein DEG17_27390 [Cyanobacteria bacterium UBA11149]|nr:hypothetical protein [Cyanobacteria bacterium UBA11367]HBE57402.1 hypothetical protein [Cyanobacteria bacterium UBA11366]HBK63323.1 hypothetical protein [Cyanobacteria bacterium UBA11166]HBR77074.1 hypothetical protein [Cyanobacteria bacterium UBA11159]HBS68369.1 hypothetical protein [Cyanobacteria bacterium UBA11153]HBW92486.1 hypothetical protein [Cyanobacteria bacterium UBA11149]HCA97596.1 hypothetical protein [Cyanobacteria bacterium UBA9226]